MPYFYLLLKRRRSGRAEGTAVTGLPAVSAK